MIVWINSRQALDLTTVIEHLAATPMSAAPRLVINNHYSLRPHRFRAVHQPDPCRDRIFHTVGAAGWQYLSSESSLRTYMNAGAPAKWGLAPKWRPWPTAASTWRQWIIPSLGVGTATALLTADYVLKTRGKTCIREDGDCTNDRR